MSSYTYKYCDPTADYQDAVNLLYTVKDELRLPDRAACQKVSDLCFKHGGMVLGYDQTTACALGGFFYGDPNDEYRDKSVAFLYVAAILPAYRLTRAFYGGLKYSLQMLKQKGAAEIRMQAEKGNPYTNRLYSRFARPLGEGRSLRGHPVMTYGNQIDEALAYFNRRRPGTRPLHSAVETA